MKYNIQILIPAILLLLPGLTHAQEKIETNVVIGACIPEQYHIGIRSHYIPNARLDFDLGSDFINDANGKLYVATVNHAYYLGKVNSKIKRKVWTINTGFSLLLEETVELKSTAGYLNLFFARELPISKRIFIQPEFGISHFLFEELVDQYDYAVKGYRTRIIPRLGLNLIMKI